MYGRCFTVRYLPKQNAKGHGEKMYLSKKFDYRVFAHLTGEQMLIGLFIKNSLAKTLLDVQSGRFAFGILRLSEIESTSLSKEQEPCRDYSDGNEDNSRSPYPTASSYNASAVKNYNATNSTACFKNYFCGKCLYFSFQHANNAY
jgi:hypothetical protein